MFDKQIGAIHEICEYGGYEYLDKNVLIIQIDAEINQGINCGHLTEELKNLL